MTIKPETVLKQIALEERTSLNLTHGRVTRKSADEITIRLIPLPPHSWAPKEKEVARFVQQEFCRRLFMPSGKEIVAHKGGSEQTVKNQLHAMREKAGLAFNQQVAFAQIDAHMSEITFRLIPPPTFGWTPQQKNIIRFIQNEFHERLNVPTMKEIAVRIRTSEQTVKNQIYEMLAKNDLESSYQLAFVQVESQT